MTMGPSEGEKDNSTSTRPSIQSVELRVSPTATAMGFPCDEGAALSFILFQSIWLARPFNARPRARPLNTDKYRQGGVEDQE